MGATLTKTEQVLAALKNGGQIGRHSGGMYVLRDRNGQEVPAWQNAIKAAWRIDLQTKHADYIAKLKANGVPLGAYTPPCGCAPIEVPIPPPGEAWDSMAMCARCLGLHHKVATFEGVEVRAVQR